MKFLTASPLHQPRPIRLRLWPPAGALALTLIFWLAGLGAAQSLAPNPSLAPAHSGRLLVGLTPALSPAAADHLFAEAGLIAVRHWPEIGLAAVELAVNSDSRGRDAALAAAQSRLSRQPDVRYVEYDWAIEAAGHTPPNDPYYPEQWALAKINMPAAWDATVGDPRLIVAIIDSGLDISHEDLAGLSLWTNESERMGTPGEDDDGNGYVDDIHGWDWVENENHFPDPYGHGTHVGGILAAQTDNRIGISSVGRSLTIMPLRVLDERGSGFISYLIDALAYARLKGAAIVNLSLVLRIDSLAVSDSIKAFVATDGLVVAATGNYGSQVYWPAAYTETIAVAATGMDDARAPFSNRGPQVDLAAPGSLILSTYLKNGYYLNDGTSMAVPHVSALAALVWSLRPDWNWLQIKNHLTATAVDVNAAILPGPDDDIGFGRIDAAAALTQAGTGISFTVDYLTGQYTRVDQPLRVPIQLSVTDTTGLPLPVRGALIHYALLGSPEVGSGGSVALPLLSGTLTTSLIGQSLLDIQLPAQVGQYELRLEMAGQARSYPIALQDGPLTLTADPARSAIYVGKEEVEIVFRARGTQGELLREPLLVELTTTLGTFSDGSQQRSRWMDGGILTETVRGGTVAGVAEILLTGAGQSQRAFVTIQPGPAQKISGPARLYVQDWGQGNQVVIRLDVRDGFGNPVWGNSRINFYTLSSTFAPQSPSIVLGKVETILSLPGWLPPRVEYWAIAPGTFSVFRGEVIIQRHHYWLPRVGRATPGQ